MDDWTSDNLARLSIKRLEALKRQAARKVLFLNGKGKGMSFHFQAVLWDTRHQAVVEEIRRREAR